ncbi:MAG: flagellar hook-basal body protein [Chloroflexi bacterium]|nr:flagellar hook-basal body protein [Chloroflexota bacterium]
MNVSLFQAASALQANERWQEMIAENMASSSIPGYKKQELSFTAVEVGLLPQSSLAPNNAPRHFVLPHARTVTSFLPGEMQLTGVKTDVAIDGSGFFEVQLPSGSTAYTRNGAFEINAQGELVTKAGYPVMGTSGTIQIDRNNPAPLSISPAGNVSQGLDNKGKIKVVDFSDPHLLTTLSGSYFLAENPNLLANESPVAALRQGFLEGTNTLPVMEMGSLLTAMRTYEANQRIIQLQDERMARAISELGNPS